MFRSVLSQILVLYSPGIPKPSTVTGQIITTVSEGGKKFKKKNLFRYHLAAEGGRKILVFFGQISKANGPKSGDFGKFGKKNPCFATIGNKVFFSSETVVIGTVFLHNMFIVPRRFSPPYHNPICQKGDVIASFDQK